MVYEVVGSLDTSVEPCSLSVWVEDGEQGTIKHIAVHHNRGRPLGVLRPELANFVAGRQGRHIFRLLVLQANSMEACSGLMRYRNIPRYLNSCTMR